MMWSRLSRRGLAIALSIAVVLTVSPTPVPRHVLEAWTAARAAARAGDTHSAEKALGDPRLPSAWFHALKADAIRLALANRNGDLALALLKDSPLPSASHATLECWRAEAEALLGQWQSAAERLGSIQGANCVYPAAELKALALREIESGNLSTAASILRSLAPLYPQDSETASLLGAYLVLEDSAAAPAAIELAASLGRPLAIDLASALATSPQGDRSALLAATGQVFLEHALWSLAAEAFRQLIEQEPGNAAAHAYYGMALDQQGLDGLAELETAERLDPSSATAQSLLGLHWQLRGQPLKAIPRLEQAVELEPESAAFRASLATARAETGDVQAALAEYRQAAELHPTDPVFWRLLATFSIEQELELVDTGLPAARNALALDQDDPTALDLAGYAHFLLGDRVTAERLAIRSLEFDPASAAARLHYGLLLSAEGRTGEARAQLGAAASLGGATSTGLFAQRALDQLGR